MQYAATSRDNAHHASPPRPRSFNRRAQVRFISIRTSFWLSCVAEEPTPRQSVMAESIAQLEWSAEVARHENTLISLRDLREHLRLRDRLVGDLERSVRDAAQAAAAQVDPMAALHAHFAARAAERRAQQAQEDDLDDDLGEGEDEAA